MERYDETRAMLKTIRLLQEEAEIDNKAGAIAITDDPKFGQQTLTNQETAFKSSVDNGAEFNQSNEVNPKTARLFIIRKMVT